MFTSQTVGGPGLWEELGLGTVETRDCIIGTLISSFCMSVFSHQLPPLHEFSVLFVFYFVLELPHQYSLIPLKILRKDYDWSNLGLGPTHFPINCDEGSGGMEAGNYDQLWEKLDTYPQTVEAHTLPSGQWSESCVVILVRQSHVWHCVLHMLTCYSSDKRNEGLFFTSSLFYHPPIWMDYRDSLR